MSVKLKLMELHITPWKHSIFDSPKCLNYRIFKEDFTLGNYFNILPDDLSKAFCNFRILNQRMPIEWGRFLGTSMDDRICELCFHNKIGDKYHYLIECSYFSDARRVYLPRNLFARPNTDTFRRLMCSSDTQELFKIAKYCKKCFRHFRKFSGIYRYLLHHLV